MSQQPPASPTCPSAGVPVSGSAAVSCCDVNNNNLATTKSTSNCTDSQTSEHIRQDLARQLDRRIGDFGGSIRDDWEAIKQFAAAEIQSNLGDAVKTDVETLLEHPQLRELVRTLRGGRTSRDTQAEVLERMTSTILPKVRRSHRQFLDRLNQQVSQMIVRLMQNDQLASVIDDERLLAHLFRLAASEDEQSSQKT